MNDELKELKGSKSRDEFRWLHKIKCDSGFTGSDIDFLLVSWNSKKILAIIDFKCSNDELTPTEVIVYDELKKNYPIYIVKSPHSSKEYEKLKDGYFYIYRYLEETKLEKILTTYNGWEDYDNWERELRLTLESKTHL